MLLRYLKPITLKHATKVKQTNGVYKNVYNNIDEYNVQMQNLTDDEISATIYGAKIGKIYKIVSVSKDKIEIELVNSSSNVISL